MWHFIIYFLFLLVLSSFSLFPLPVGYLNLFFKIISCFLYHAFETLTFNIFLSSCTLLARLMVISSEVHSGFVGEHLRVTCDPVQKQRNRTLKVPGVPEYYRKFTSRCSSPYPCQEVSLRNPRGSVSMLDNKTQSPMGASLELQNTCPI